MTHIELIGRHVADTGMCSVMHHARQASTTYDQIIAKGWDIVPDILYYLEEYYGGMHVMMLLMDITKEKPYLPKVHGHWNVLECRQAWIEWGKQKYSKTMEKIPTAEEHYRSIVGCTPNEIDQHSCTTDAMISFAKRHVLAALKKAAEKAEVKFKYERPQSGDTQIVDEESILSAYPLENIK